MTKYLKVLFIVFSFTSIAIILSHHAIISTHWLFSFVYLSIPILIIVNFSIFLLLIFRRSYFVIVSIIVLITSIPHLKETFALNFKKPHDPSKTFSLTSYNVGTFNYQRFEDIVDTIATINTMGWLKSNRHSDILCLQEFFNNDANDHESTLDSLSELGYIYYYTNPVFNKNHKGFFGVITLSKYPILKGGSLIYGDESLNRGIYTDILIHNDTLRIINIHLKSMTIRLKESSGFAETLTDISQRLKFGFINRNKEIDYIYDFVKESPYKTIVCGDFNDMPYSYPYRKLKATLKNTFEEAGYGFGFTYNKFPYYIRIDNQFHDPRLRALDFEVHDDTYGSDHYPIEGRYALTENVD